MKSSVLFFIAFLPFFLSAQISVDQSDMPETGDTIRQSLTVNLGSFDFEETGEDHTWDFSDFSHISQSVDTFVAVNETPFLYQILFFFTANLAKKQFELDQFEGFQITDSYQFFKNSSSSYKEVGVGVTLNGIPLPTLYDDPDVIYKFPLTSGSVDSSMSNYDFDIPFLGYYGGWKKRVNTVDGWGTLKTPFGTFETIRLKSEVIQFDSLYIDSLGFGLPIYREFTEYKWLGKDMGLPLCTVTDNGLLQSVSYIDSLRSSDYTGIKTVATEVPFTVFPNPAGDHINVSLTIPMGENYRIQLVTMNGALIFSHEGAFKGDILTLDLSSYNLLPGTYLVLFTGLDKSYTRKVVIQ